MFRPEHFIFNLKKMRKLKSRMRVLGAKVALAWCFLNMVLSGLMIGAMTVAAAVPGSVVINEVAWAGSVNSSSDEWLELYNSSGAVLSLSGWKLKNNGAVVFTFPATASIVANGYFLIEDTENSVSNVTADAIFNMSLVNTGASLQILDAADAVMDTVNASAGSWYAGSNTSHATMERKDANAGDLASNFVSSTGNGALASAGGAIVGTPRALNSASTVPVGATTVKALWSVANAMPNDIVKLTVKVENVSDLFNYGLEINYDPALLQFQNAVAGSFLSNSGAFATSFQSGLKAGAAGNLLLAEARTIDPKVGISGSGNLFEVNFKVIGAAGTNAAVSFANSSFLASSSTDITANMQGVSLVIGGTTIAPVTALVATEGSGRYQIKLSWVTSTSAPDSYRVERQDAHGNFVVLGGTTLVEFIDQDSVVGGGNIIPGVNYRYRVSAVKGAALSTSVEISAMDVRGVKGDNNRTDLVDGRDLEKLARHFAELDTVAGFDALADTTYDGRIDGSDLIDIGANFARKY